jgi:hypothetical protein
VTTGKKWFTKEKLKFLAGYFSDLSKAILSLAIASKFFGDMPTWTRLVLPAFGFVLFVLAMWILPKGDNHD